MRLHKLGFAAKAPALLELPTIIRCSYGNLNHVVARMKRLRQLPTSCVDLKRLVKQPRLFQSCIAIFPSGYKIAVRNSLHQMLVILFVLAHCVTRHRVAALSGRVVMA